MTAEIVTLYRWRGPPSRLAPGRRHPLAGLSLPLPRRFLPLRTILADRASESPAALREERREAERMRREDRAR